MEAFPFWKCLEGMDCRGGLKEGAPCVEARGLSDNGKRMGRKLSGEAEQGSKKGRVSGNSPQQCSKHEAS